MKENVRIKENTKTFRKIFIKIVIFIK